MEMYFKFYFLLNFDVNEHVSRRYWKREQFHKNEWQPAYKARYLTDLARLSVKMTDWKNKCKEKKFGLLSCIKMIKNSDSIKKSLLFAVSVSSH